MHLYINLSVTSSLTIIIKTTISLAQCVCTYSKRKETRILHGTGEILEGNRYQSTVSYIQKSTRLTSAGISCAFLFYRMNAQTVISNKTFPSTFSTLIRNLSFFFSRIITVALSILYPPPITTG